MSFVEVLVLVVVVVLGGELVFLFSVVVSRAFELKFRFAFFGQSRAM